MHLPHQEKVVEVYEKNSMKKYSYQFIFIMLLSCYFMYSISGIYGFELIPDEFGYWAYAAALSGCDWSEVISIGSYYSFGYTLILYPIFQICKDPVTAYRTAVTVNFLFMAVAYFILTRLLVLIKGKETPFTPIMAAIAIFYPSWLYYSRTTMAETLIMGMYLVICICMYLYLENNKPQTLAMLVISLVYIYTIHMRTVGLLIAAIMTFGAHLYRTYLQHQYIQKRTIVFYVFIIIIGIALWFAANKVKLYISEQVYTQEAAKAFSHNDYSGQMAKVKAVFTMKGFQNLLVSLTGKILYLGLASFGLFYWGITYCLEKLIKEKKLFYLFILLATAGEIAIASIYTMGTGGRIDSLTYGRYDEQVLPILMALGCIKVMEGKAIPKKVRLVAGCHLPLVGFIIYIIQKYEQTNIHAYMILGLSYFFDEKNFEPIAFHMVAYITATVLMVVVITLLRLAKHRQIGLFLVAVIILELLLGMRLASIFSKETQLANFRDVQLVSIIQEQAERHTRLIYLQEDGRAFADNLQFQLRDEKMQLEREEMNLAKSDLVVTDYLYSNLDGLKEQYENWRIMGHFAVFYN